jgi:hypothetical protein
MIHTQFRDDHRTIISNRVPAYNRNQGGGFQLAVSYFEQTGDGAVHTSVEDMLKWDENFYSGRVGGREFLAEIQERGRLNNNKLLDYAKGLFIGTQRGLPTVEHAGSWGGYRAQLLRFPEQHFSVVCLCNLGNANPVRRAAEVAEIFLTNQMKAKEPLAVSTPPVAPREMQTDPAKLSAYVGDYASDELGVVYRLGISDSKLVRTAVLESGGFPRAVGSAALRPIAVDQFAMGQGLTFIFARDSQDHVTGFSVISGRAKGILFTRVSSNPGR